MNKPSQQAIQTVDAVIKRLLSLQDSISEITGNFTNAAAELKDIEVTRSQQPTLDRILVEINAGIEGCNGLSNYYAIQINNLSAAQARATVDTDVVEVQSALPAVAQEQQPVPQPLDMTDPNAPRPGSAAWRILQRTAPDLARQLTTFNSEPTPAEVPTQAAAAVQPSPLEGPYDRVVPSFAAKPELAPAPETTRRSTVARPTRPVPLQAATHSAPSTQLTDLPVAVEAPQVSKLPDPVPREPQAIPTLKTPPNSYQRLTTPRYSPLIRAFAPAPWLENGTGVITVGTKGWPEIQEDIFSKNNFDMVRSEQGFYRNQGDDFPSSVLIRLRTFAVLWTFGTEPGDILVYQVGLSDAGTNDHRWFPAHTLPPSSITRLLGELNTYLGTADVPFDPAAA